MCRLDHRLDHDIAPNVGGIHMHPQTAPLCINVISLDVACAKMTKAHSNLVNFKKTALRSCPSFHDSLRHANLCDNRGPQSPLFQTHSPSHCHPSHHPTIMPPSTNVDSFSKHLKALDEWKRLLLEHLECVSCHNQMHDLISSGQSIKFTLASNGSARGNLGSLGWKIAIGHKILWQCMEPTFGLWPCSFRAELCGLLLAPLFLQVSCVFHNCHGPKCHP
jgi:hypothetical protein